jgi:hypothetical protein
VLGQLGVDYDHAAIQFGLVVTDDDRDGPLCEAEDGFEFFSEFVFPHLGLDDGELIVLGFQSGYIDRHGDGSAYDGDVYVGYDELDEAWRALIVERRVNDAI